MKALDPLTKQVKFFVDKCLPFGASISCALFQCISDALRHILDHRVAHRVPRGKSINNYLDDFLFVAWTCWLCNWLVQEFAQLCQITGFPINFNKTEYASQIMVFLGILLNGIRLTLLIPEEKRLRAIDMLKYFLSKKKVTVKQLQVLCGFLNFLCRTVFPGRPFLRRMYAKYSFAAQGRYLTGLNQTRVNKIKPHHHVHLDEEFRLDCEVWLKFLDTGTINSVCRPMIDLQVVTSAVDLGFTSDASANPRLGYGVTLGDNWLSGCWDAAFILDKKPSIEYLELFALLAGILTWEYKLQNIRLLVHCDNQVVVAMINNLLSSCKNCMKLLRILTLNNLNINRRVFAVYISMKDNYLTDALSRGKIELFFKKATKTVNRFADKIDPAIWPMSKLWIDH